MSEGEAADGMIEFDVYVRLDAHGNTTAVTDADIANGTTLDDGFNNIDGVYRDAKIRVRMRAPDAVDEHSDPAARIDVPDDQPTAVTARAVS